MAFESFIRAIYEETAKKMNGRNSRDIAAELEKKSDAIGEIQKGIGDATNNVMLGRAKEELKDASKVLAKFDVKNVQKPGTVGGDAQLSTPGSAEIDLLKHSGQDGLPDERKLTAVEKHEDTHERQKKPDADVVQVGDKSIDSTAFIEVGAIIRQTNTVPESLGDLSAKYRNEYYQDMLALMPDRKRLEELSMSGQFQQFAREVEARMAA